MHSTSVDTPLVSYTGSSVGTNRQFLHKNHQGSVIAITNNSGAVIATNTYDAYGVPATGNQGRFGYTGQMYLSELGLYHYRARVYNPHIGRFMQTDPIGYEDQMNLYAYVGNDPLNSTDPSGMCPWCVVGAVIGAAVQTYVEVKNGSFDKGFMEGAKAVGRIAVSSAAGAAGGGLGTAVAKVAGVVSRVALNTTGSAVIGGTAAAGNQLVSGQEVTSDAVIDGATTGALFGAGGAVAGEVIEAGGRALVAAEYSSASTATKNVFDHVAGATPGTAVNTGQQAGPGAVTLANTAANAVSNSASLTQQDQCAGRSNCP